MTATLTALYRYPVKSTQAQSLSSSSLTPSGLPFDRSWMVAAVDGRMITGRSHPALVRVTAQPDAAGLTLDAPDMGRLFVANDEFCLPHRASVWKDDFSAWHGAAAADAWFSHYLGEPVKLLWTGAAPSRRLQESIPLSFADAYPLLLIGEASLTDLNHRVGRTLEMQRFRPNLVIGGTPAFAEDGWQRIRIGSAVLRLSKPCERCVFTTVDPATAEKSADQEPLRSLARFRKGADGVLFGQNVIVESGEWLEVGMPVEVLS
jgi:uncharacterized protein YcbX